MKEYIVKLNEAQQKMLETLAKENKLLPELFLMAMVGALMDVALRLQATGNNVLLYLPIADQEMFRSITDRQIDKVRDGEATPPSDV